ncbi:MAG: hypothetical protein AB1765_11895 [Candidatus Hydrogenedentota bacterium]
MKAISITTTSFGEKWLNALKEKGYQIITNFYGRKLEKDEILEICKDSVGIIAGTEKIIKI